MRNDEKSNNLKVWIIPLIAILFTLVWGLFTRLTVGIEDEQKFDFGTIPFVPAESPHASGPDSR